MLLERVHAQSESVESHPASENKVILRAPNDNDIKSLTNDYSLAFRKSITPSLKKHLLTSFIKILECI